MSRRLTRWRPRGASLGLAVALAGCTLSTGPAGSARDVRGSWSYSGTQLTPLLQLEGTLSITDQSGEQVTGTMTWTEQDAVGNVVVRGGSISGTVVESTDIDFDVVLAGETRRHIALLVADTMEGVWAVTTPARSGQFRAVRQVP